MTNFLDDQQQDWTNPEYEQLRDLLVACVGRDGRLGLQQLAESAGIAPGTFPEGHDTVRTAATELIKEMGQQGKLRPLAVAAGNLPTAYAERLRGMLTLPPRPTGPSGPSRPPTPDPRDIPAHKVRDLLMAAFNAEGLRRIFVYTSHPTLRDLTNEFSPKDSLAAMIDKVVPYCQQQDVMPELLAEVREANPRRYARWESQL